MLISAFILCVGREIIFFHGYITSFRSKWVGGGVGASQEGKGEGRGGGGGAEWGKALHIRIIKTQRPGHQCTVEYCLA